MKEKTFRQLMAALIGIALICIILLGKDNMAKAEDSRELYYNHFVAEWGDTLYGRYDESYGFDSANRWVWQVISLNGLNSRGDIKEDQIVVYPYYK